MIIQILFDFFFQNTVDVNLDTALKFGNITANTAITSFVCINSVVIRMHYIMHCKLLPNLLSMKYFLFTEPHVTITVFDLKTFELRDFRRDIYLSEAEFTEMSRNDTTFADVCLVIRI